MDWAKSRKSIIILITIIILSIIKMMRSISIFRFSLACSHLSPWKVVSLSLHWLQLNPTKPQMLIIIILSVSDDDIDE